MSLIDHPTRERWNPGAGGMCTHSIQFDPRERPDDVRGHLRGRRLPQRRRRRHVDAEEQGNGRRLQRGRPFPEVGQCVHKVLVHPAQTGAPLAAEPLRRLPHGRPGRELGAARGQRPSERLRLSDRDPPPTTRTWPSSIPEDSARGSAGEVGGGDRVTSDGRLGVYRDQDGGQSWELASNGLPERAWVEVLREGMASDRLDPVGIYFGTKSGSVFVSPNEGDEWIEAARHLPAVLSVEVAEW